MESTGKLTQKGQVTIPLNIRKKLNVKPNERVSFHIENDNVVIKKASDFFTLQGSIKTDKKFDLKEMKKTTQAHVAKKHGKLD